MLMLDV